MVTIAAPIVAVLPLYGPEEPHLGPFCIYAYAASQHCTGIFKIIQHHDASSVIIYLLAC